MNILFLYLDAFLQTGGIEKFNRAFMKALQDISGEQNYTFKAVSVYDNDFDARYIDETNYKGFKGNRVCFTVKTLFSFFKYDVVILGHLNLAAVGVLIKLLRPKTRIILIAHGIEVWDEQPFMKARLLKQADVILAVSNFTKSKILEHNDISPDKIKIFPNTIDPYFKLPNAKEKPNYLLERYGLSKDTKIILTITRINRHEVYKGYDLVLQVLPDIVNLFPNVKYLLCGKYGPFEEARLKQLVEKYKLEDHFILTGYVKDEELIDHYLLGDVFALPSKKEGFGIVFIEALICGLPVIAGNKDGSVDALLNGKAGKLIDPENSEELSEAIVDLLNEPSVDNREIVLENFSFDQFKKRLRTILIEN